MMTLGIDPSLTSYGWCVIDTDAEPRNQIIKSGHTGTLKTTVPVARFMHFRSLVSSILNCYHIDAVGIESPAYGGGPFSEIHFGLMLFSLESIFEKRKDCVLFDPTTLKYLVGGAKFDKSDIRRYVQLDTMNNIPMQSDEADAYCVAKFTSRFIKFFSGKLKPDDLSQNERRIFLERTKKVKRNDKTIIKSTSYIFKENNRFFQFSQIPAGSVTLPGKSQINSSLLKYLEDLK